MSYFLEKPFQNWTRTSADIMGTVFFYVGYDLPVQAIRDFVPEILKGPSCPATRVHVPVGVCARAGALAIDSAVPRSAAVRVARHVALLR